MNLLLRLFVLLAVFLAASGAARAASDPDSTFIDATQDRAFMERFGPSGAVPPRNTPILAPPRLSDTPRFDTGTGPATAAAPVSYPPGDFGDANNDPAFVERFGTPDEIARMKRTVPQPSFAPRSPWKFFQNDTSRVPVIKPPPPIPRARIEPIPRAPGPNLSWQPNHWEWNEQRFVWQPGRWVVVAPGLQWAYGTWVPSDIGGWLWRTGGWVPPPPVPQMSASAKPPGNIQPYSFPPSPLAR